MSNNKKFQESNLSLDSFLEDLKQNKYIKSGKDKVYIERKENYVKLAYKQLRIQVSICDNKYYSLLPSIILGDINLLPEQQDNFLFTNSQFCINRIEMMIFDYRLLK